jgi:hypothetical protein
MIHAGGVHAVRRSGAFGRDPIPPEVGLPILYVTADESPPNFRENWSLESLSLVFAT